MLSLYADGSVKILFSNLLSFDNCIATANCMSILSSIGNCTVQYNSDQKWSFPVTVPFNSSFHLPLMESSTLYHFRIIFTLDLEPITLNTSYMTPQNHGIVMTYFFYLCDIICNGCAHSVRNFSDPPSSCLK